MAMKMESKSASILKAFFKIIMVCSLNFIILFYNFYNSAEAFFYSEGTKIMILTQNCPEHFKITVIMPIGVRAAAPPNFGQLRFFGQHEEISAKPVFKDVSMFLLLF